MNARVIPYEGERWFQLLKDACEATSVTAVAAKLGYGRARVSQVLNGIDANGAKPDKVAAKVLALYDRWTCPYLNAEITGEECKETHSGQTPTHDPAKLAQRRTCRTCPHRAKHTVTEGS